jgi:hypothetical protein
LVPDRIFAVERKFAGGWHARSRKSGANNGRADEPQELVRCQCQPRSSIMLAHGLQDAFQQFLARLLIISHRLSIMALQPKVEFEDDFSTHPEAASSALCPLIPDPPSDLPGDWKPFLSHLRQDLQNIAKWREMLEEKRAWGPPHLKVACFKRRLCYRLESPWRSVMCANAARLQQMLACLRREP